jgi:hypothetical protein
MDWPTCVTVSVTTIAVVIGYIWSEHDRLKYRQRNRIDDLIEETEAFLYRNSETRSRDEIEADS